MLQGAHARAVVVVGAVVLGGLGGWVAAIAIAADLLTMVLAGALAGFLMGSVVDPERL